MKSNARNVGYINEIDLSFSLICVSRVARSFRSDTSKLGKALGMSPRAAFIRIYGKIPISSIMATLATIMMTLPPLIWRSWRSLGGPRRGGRPRVSRFSSWPAAGAWHTQQSGSFGRISADGHAAQSPRKTHAKVCTHARAAAEPRNRSAVSRADRTLLAQASCSPVSHAYAPVGQLPRPSPASVATVAAASRAPRASPCLV